MDFINVPIAWLLKLCGTITANKYVFTLLCFAVVMKLLLAFLGVKQHKNSIKQARLRPKEAAIMKKYKGRNDKASQMKRQQEIQELQQSGGYSQFAGCLPMIVQLVLVIFIYNIIRSPLTYLTPLNADAIDIIKDMANSGVASDVIDAIRLEGASIAEKVLDEKLIGDEIAAVDYMYWNFSDVSAVLAEKGLSLNGLTRESLPNFYLFGQNLSKNPTLGFNWLVLIPILTFALTFASSKLNRKLMYQSPQMQSQGADAKMSFMIMDFALPLLSTYITFSVPGVIGIYWIYQNLLGVLQQFIFVKLMPYPTFTEEDYKEAEREILGKKKKKVVKVVKDPDRPRVRSLHHIDDDEYNAKVVDDGTDHTVYTETDADGMLMPVTKNDKNTKSKAIKGDPADKPIIKD